MFFLFYTVTGLHFDTTPYRRGAYELRTNVFGSQGMSERSSRSMQPIFGYTFNSDIVCAKLIRATSMGVVFLFYTVTGLHFDTTPIDVARTSFAQTVSEVKVCPNVASEVCNQSSDIPLIPTSKLVRATSMGVFFLFYTVIGLHYATTPIDGARTSFAQKVSGFSTLSSGYLLVALPLTGRVPASHKSCRDFLRCHRATSWSHSH